MKKAIVALCTIGLMVACGQKQAAVVSVPASQINVESLLDSIDYDMDISGLPLADIRVLRNAPAAKRGYPFKDAYLRGVYGTTSWYDSLMYALDEKLPWDQYKSKDDENWHDYYYRVIDESKAMDYTQQEQAFMKRLKSYEDELMKQNFTVPEGMRVNIGNLLNPTQLKEFNEQLSTHLAQEGFGIIPAKHAQLFQLYEENDYREFPSFVTTDLYLQLYHLYIDCMLREIEEQHLLPLMIRYTTEMQKATKGMTFFNVAYSLLTGQNINAATDPVAAAEVEKVKKGQNDFSSYMQDYKEIMFSYSLFRPRGHYTRSEALQRYFRGMMWLQSASFGLDHPDEVKRAIVIADAMQQHKEVLALYEKTDRLITYLMGRPDNLSILQVMNELNNSGKTATQLIGDDAALAQFTAKLNKIGDEQTRIRPKFERTSHNKVCVMPQRYQSDAEVLQEMVDYDNNPTQRATPKGLDIFAAMGITTAERILLDEGQKWKDFKPMLDKMKKRMGETDWSETIATQWLQSLKVLNEKEQRDKLPYFMVNPLWSKKDLNAALASWAELKHDAILYAKQPMGAECGGGGPPDPIVRGYVEPNIGFWRKAVELLDNTAKLLIKQEIMTEKIRQATERIREEAQFLLRMSEKELEGKVLSDEEYKQLEIIGSTFENISLDLIREPDQYLMGWDDVQGADKRVALVADVYTANADNNPDKSILFEAVGDADEIYVVVEIDGYLYLMRGAVMSYREFSQPLGAPRLTDEEWQQQLEKQPRKGVPAWMNDIIVPLEKTPEANEEYFYSSGC